MLFNAHAIETYSQESRISVTESGMQLARFFKTIEKQSDFMFFYVDSDIKDIHVNVNVKEASVKAALNQALSSTGLVYEIHDRYVTILPANLLEKKSQAITITGTVSDEAGEPLPGVNVVIKGTSTGVVTGIDGRYSINVPGRDAILVFSFMGYAAQELIVDNQQIISVTLEEVTKEIEEVVVIGYGTSRKKDLTGAVSRVNATRFENEKPQSVQDILRGQVAGLNISVATSAKGGGNMVVRGMKSIRDTDDNQNAANYPLIVLDGVIFSGALEDINPNDIESIDLLKDASSAAVYGAKAASGVLAITTKKGKTGKPMINVNASVGLAQVATMPEVYGPNEFLDFRREVFRNENRYGAGADKLYLFDNPDNLPSGVSLDQWLDGSTEDPTTLWLARLGLKPLEIANYKAGKSVNWRDVVFQTGLRQDYNVSLSGRKDEISYYWSLGYNDNEGIVYGDKYSVYRSRLNVEGKITDFLTVGANTQFSYRDESAIPANWNMVMTNSPWGSFYADDGVTLRLSPVDDTGRNAFHPLHDMTYQDRSTIYSNLNANLYAKITLPFDITYQITYAPHWQWYSYYNHQSTKSPDYVTKGGGATREQNNLMEWQVDNLLKWNKTLGDHQIDVTLLANAEKFQSWQDVISVEKFLPNDALGFHSVSAAQNKTVGSNDEYSTADAYMARLFYSYKSRYMTTLSVRRDGYSAFGRSNPRGTFASAAVAWAFSEEPFIDLPWLSYGKLRLSWGTNGNRNIGRYASYARMTPGQYTNQAIGGAASNVSTLFVGQMENSLLKWEHTENLNLGLDFSFLNNRMDGSIEVYRMNTRDVLLNRKLIWVDAFASVFSNLGEVKNTGFELTLNAKVLERENLKWSTSFNFSLNRNEIVHLYGDMVDVKDADGNVIGRKENDDLTNQRFIGHALDAVWDFRVLGVWQAGQADEAMKFNQRPGDFRLHDPDGNYKMENSDKDFLGYKEPRFRWTWRNEFNIFKNFDVSFMMYSHWGHYGAFNHAKNKDGDPARVNAYVQPFYTPENPQTRYARITSTDPVGFSVWWKRSFIKLDNVSVGYTLPKSIVDRVKIQNLKVYASVRNAGFYAAEWELWDPETSNIPTPRYWTLGVNITL